MIAFFNKLGNSWVAKIICAILGISMMAFWGLGGLSITGGKDDTVAIVGGEKISIAQVSKAFDVAREQLSTLSGHYVSPKKAIELGLLDQVVEQQVNEVLSTLIQDDIGLTASDAAVRKYVEYNPLFADNLGKFDTNLFYTYLSQMKMSQNDLAQKLQTELANKHLTEAVLKSVPRQQQLMAQTAQAQKEKRVVSFVEIKQSDLPVSQPSTNELKDYYEAYQDEFMTPEYRDIQLLSITPDLFQKDTENAYDKMYKIVQDLEDALGEGIPLAQACQKLSLPIPTNLTIDLSGNNVNGTLANTKLKDNPLLQEAFILSPGEATSIMDFGNGFMVMEVKKIIPVTVRPFNQVIAQVTALWKSEQQKDTLPKTVSEVVQNLTENQKWGKYTPTTETVSRSESHKFPKVALTKLFTQSVGSKNVQTFTTDSGTLIMVVDRIINNNATPTEEEKSQAVNTWAQDLMLSIQNTFANKYKVKVNNDAVKSAFATYMKEE